MNTSKLRFIIKDKGFSIKKIAGKAGTNDTSIYQIFKKGCAQTRIIESICNVLDISVAELYEDIEYILNSDNKTYIRIGRENIDESHIYSDERIKVTEKLNEGRKIYALPEGNKYKIEDISYEYGNSNEISEMKRKNKEQEALIIELREIIKGYRTGKIIIEKLE